MKKIRLSKRTLTQFIRFDCERLLKNMMTPEKKGVEAGKDRPGLETIQEIGHEWEQEQYKQLIEAINDNEKIAYSYNKKEDKFETIDLINILKSKKIPDLLIEASFNFLNIFDNLNYNIFNFEGARPDIIWITEVNDKKVLNIIDIKTAAEPSLKHFSEVVLYALSLDKLLKSEKLDDRFLVNLEIGYIWPGTHDVDLFIKIFNSYQARSSNFPLRETLNDILVPVKLELYYEHVLSFFEERVPKVYNLKYDDASWFFNKRCSLCDYREECSDECNKKQLIHQIPDIRRGQVETLMNAGIFTLEQIISDEDSWKNAIQNNITLKPVKKTLQTKAQAIIDNKILEIPDKKTYLMPNWSDVSVFIEIHFDPITGLAYAMGLQTKIWNKYQGEFANIESEVFINDKAGANEKIFENSSEKTMFIEFLKSINRTIQYSIQNKLSIHLYFWDSLELKQLKRMMTRYFQDENVLKELEELMQFFAPEGSIENPDIFETIPGTVVKNTLSYLLALPLKFDYSLINSANAILKDQGKKFQYYIHKHFFTEMNDQIPFERAYDLWTNRVRINNPELVKRYKDLGQKYKSDDVKYTREKVREILKITVAQRLKALQEIVSYMQQFHKNQLLLSKKPLTKIQPVKKRNMDKRTNELYMFERLNHITRDLENKQQRLLPVDEKEARFISMRGLILLDRSNYLTEIKLLLKESKNSDSTIDDYYVFSIPETSLDAKIKEGDFLLALSNEVDPFDPVKPQVNTDLSVMNYLDNNYYEIVEMAQKFGLKNSEKIPRVSLKAFLQVSLQKIFNNIDVSYIIVKANNYYGNTIEFAFIHNLLNQDLPFVIDPVYRDFNLSDYEKILKIIGEDSGKKAKKRGKRK